MKSTRFTVLLLAALMLVGSMATPATAQTTPATEWSSSRWKWSSPSAVMTDPWKLSANIYLWFPSAPVDIETEGQKVHVPEQNIIILKSLLLGVMFEGEVHKGPFGVFISPIYYKGELSDTVSGPLGGSREVTLDESVWLISYGVSYDLATYRFGDEPGSPTVTLQPFAGGS